jgi:NAD(P)H-flavin reductase
LLIANAPVEKNIELDNQIYLLKVHCPEIAGKIKPGEFLNIRVSEAIHPLLGLSVSAMLKGIIFTLCSTSTGRNKNFIAEARRRYY